MHSFSGWDSRNAITRKFRAEMANMPRELECDQLDVRIDLGSVSKSRGGQENLVMNVAHGKK